MHMMAPQFAPVNSLQSDPPASSSSEDFSSAAQKKKTSRWTETEEKILIELFSENEENFAMKHIICQNGNLLQSICTRDVGENMFQVIRAS